MKIKILCLALIALSLGCTNQNFSKLLSGNNSNKVSCSSTSALGLKVSQLNQDLEKNITASETTKVFDERDFESSVAPVGTEIIVTVDRDCVLQHIGSTVLKDIFAQVKNTKNGFMTQQSLSWRLKRCYNLAELKQIALSVPCVLALSPNQKLELQSMPNDEHYSKLTHLNTVKYESVYDKLFVKPVLANNVVTVAIIDAGNDLKHPDLMGQHWENLKEKNGTPGVDDDGNGYVDDIQGWNFTNKTGNPGGNYQMPHGEHVSGLIGAIANNGVGVVGLAAPRVKLMHLNIFEMIIPGMGQPDPLILLEEALRYAADNGAQVINLSLGTTKTSVTMQAALKYALDKGVFIVAAAGNNGFEISETSPFSPAMYARDFAGMIAVAANDSTPTFSGNVVCGFSNFSPSYIDIAAPGCDTTAAEHGLLSTDRITEATANFPYKLMAGTSMASPLVAATAAATISYIKEKSGVAPSNILVKKILKEGSRIESKTTAKVDQGRSLDLPTLFSYIDKQILMLDCK